MKVSAQVFGEHVVGKVFYFPAIQKLQTDKAKLSVVDTKHRFNVRYESLKQHLKTNIDQNDALFDFKRAYYQTLHDDSFKNRIIHYLNLGYSRSDALMCFFENDIFGVLSERISSELFGLLRLLSCDEPTPIGIHQDSIVCSKSLTYADIFNLPFDKVSGVLLTNSTYASHDTQILTKLSIPCALVEPGIDLFKTMANYHRQICAFHHNYIELTHIQSHQPAQTQQSVFR